MGGLAAGGGGRTAAAAHVPEIRTRHITETLRITVAEPQIVTYFIHVSSYQLPHKDANDWAYLLRIISQD